MTFFTTQLFNGLTAGVIYSLIAVGYSLVYGILQQINFAHGYIYMVGAYVTLSAMLWGAPVIIACLVGIAVGVALSIIIERVAYRPVRGYRMAPTVTAVAAGLMLENAARLIWGSEPRAMDFPLQDDAFAIGSIIVTPLQIIAFAVAFLMAGALYLIASRTNLGRGMRAVRDDLPTAELMGMPVNRIIVFVYALGGALGVVGGIIYGAYYGNVSLTMGFAGTLNAFTATIIGGMGSIWGPFIGGLLLGVTQSMVTGYISSSLLNTVTFVLLTAFLLVRPRGLLGQASTHRL